MPTQNTPRLVLRAERTPAILTKRSAFSEGSASRDHLRANRTADAKSLCGAVRCPPCVRRSTGWRPAIAPALPRKGDYGANHHHKARLKCR
jgi:hypothetical protein